MKKIINKITILMLLYSQFSIAQTLSPRQDTLLKYLNSYRLQPCNICAKIDLGYFKTKQDFKHPLIEKRMLEIVNNEWNKDDLKRVDSMINIDLNDETINRNRKRIVNERIELENEILNKVKEERFSQYLPKKYYRGIDKYYYEKYKKEFDSSLLYSMYFKTKEQIDSVINDTIKRKNDYYKIRLHNFKIIQKEYYTRSETPSEYYFYWAWLKGKESIPLFLGLSKDTNVMKKHKGIIEVILAKLEVEPYKSKVLEKYSFNNKLQDSMFNFDCYLQVLTYLNSQESYYHLKGMFVNKNRFFYGIYIKFYDNYICASHNLFRLLPNVLEKDTASLTKLKKMDSLCDRIDNIYTEEDYFEFGRKVANWIEANKGRFILRKEDEIDMPYCYGGLE